MAGRKINCALWRAWTVIVSEMFLTRNSIWVILWTVLASVGSAAPRPNIVFMMADDMGYGELGVTGQLDRAANGQPHIQTPALDDLANRGMMLSNFYATPICASTRSALMSGLHNGHSPVDRNGGGGNGGNAIRAVDRTMASALRDAGYVTGAYGKWGLGGMDGPTIGATSEGALINLANPRITHLQATPNFHGFDEFYGYLNQVHAHRYYVEYLWQHDVDDSGDPGGMEVDFSPAISDYTANLISEKSLQFISDHASGAEPFFLYLPTTIPHSDFNPPGGAGSIRQGFIDDGYSSAQANYAAMMRLMDNHIADVVGRLKDPNQDGDESDSVYDDTLIVFISDNGGTGGQMDLFDARAGLRGVKGNVHEGGTKTPFIAHWNGTIAPGVVNDLLVGDLTDLFSTFATLAGADVPVGLDSADLSGLFTGGQVERRGYHIFEARVANDWAIRMGDWKLSKSGSNALGLYDLANDVGESNDLKNSRTEIRNLLQQIALDEGVESDAGSGGAQTTHIVQYKSWAPVGGSEDWAAASNWAGGTAVNTRGSNVNNFNSGPANNWIPTLDNTTASALRAAVGSSSEVLGLDLAGSGNEMRVAVEAGATLTVRNGARVRSGGVLAVEGGALETVRTIQVLPGGSLTGAGEIRSIYPHSIGDLPQLPARVVNEGRVEVVALAGTGGGGPASTEIVRNGGFEAGSGNAFSATDGWFNFAGDNTRNARNTANPDTGSRRGIIGNNGVNITSPAQDTGHLIRDGDSFDLSIRHAGASQWDVGSDSFEVALYYLDGGSPVDLWTAMVTPQQNFGSGYNTFAADVSVEEDSAAVGNSLHLRFESNAADGEFGSIDNVSIVVSSEGEGTPDVDSLLIRGEFDQSLQGTLAVTLDATPEKLVVTGAARLAGLLEVDFADGFTPEAGSIYDVLVAGQITGGFGNFEGVVVAGGISTFKIQQSATAINLEKVADGMTALGTPNWWLAENGLVSDTEDSDGDGRDDATEYVANTDPNDAADFLAGPIAVTGAEISISWQGRPDRMYSVERSSDLLDWEEVAVELRGGGILIYEEPAGSGEKGFFRIVAGLDR